MSGPTNPRAGLPHRPGATPADLSEASEATLSQALRDGASDRFERAAVHLALATGLLSRPDIQARYLLFGPFLDGTPVAVGVQWSTLAQDLDVDPPPLSTAEDAALRVACSLAGQGCAVNLAACLSKLDANLRLAASGAFRRVLLGPADPDPVWQATS